MGIINYKILKKNKFYFILVLVWIFSVALRIQYIQKEPDFTNTANIFMLTALEIWNESSPAENNFAMNTTYSNSGDKHISYYVRLMTEEGDNYYVSHTPFALIFAYFVTVFGVFEMSNAGLQVILLLLQLISAIYLFKLLRNILQDREYKSEISLLISSIYLLHPIILFQYTFHYFAESFGQVFFIIFLYYLSKYETNHLRFATKAASMFLIGFAFVYSEWLGVFVLAVAFVIFFIFFNTTTKIKILIISAIVGGLIAISLFVYQHVALNNIETFIRALGIRFLERSGFFGNELTDMGYSYSNIESYKLLLNQVFNLFKGIGFLIPILVLLNFRNIKSKFLKSRILFVSAGSCFLYFVFLFSATITHYIYMSKFLIPLLIFTALIVDEGIIRKLFNTKIKYVLAISVFLGFFIHSFLVFNNYVEKNVKQKTEFFREMKSYVSQNSDSSQSILVQIPEEMSYTDIIYLSYAIKRNVAVLKDKNDVIDFFKNIPIENAIFFYYCDIENGFNHHVFRRKDVLAEKGSY